MPTAFVVRERVPSFRFEFLEAVRALPMRPFSAGPVDRPHRPLPERPVHGIACDAVLEAVRALPVRPFNAGLVDRPHRPLLERPVGTRRSEPRWAPSLGRSRRWARRTGTACATAARPRARSGRRRPPPL